MQLTEGEIRQIQILLGYPTQQLHPGSKLRCCLKTIADNDARYNLTIINDIVNNLNAIAKIDCRIDEIKSSGSDAVRREKIDDEYEIEYKNNKDTATSLKEQRSKLIETTSPLILKKETMPDFVILFLAMTTTAIAEAKLPTVFERTHFYW